MAVFSISEHYVLGLFKPGATFTYKNNIYTVLMAGKPICSFGEPKTDIYVLAKSCKHEIELKISFKQANAEFLENKMKPERAEQVFGSDWNNIIKNATIKIADKFKDRPVVFFNKKGKTEEGCITLGWKFELLNVPSGDLSAIVPLTRKQKLDVYAGTSLRGDKRDSYVNGKQICESGIANCIIFSDIAKIVNIQDAVNSIIDMDDYIDNYAGNIYFACKALNYRSLYSCNGRIIGKYDGNRPLSVYIKWSAYKGHLLGEFVFDEPLLKGGNYAYTHLREALDELGVNSTNDFDSSLLINVKYN